jgi:hypothetical protein
MSHNFRGNIHKLITHALKSVAAQEIAPDLPPEWRQKLNVVYFPQLGYLVSLPMSDYMIETNDLEVRGLVFQVCYYCE